MKHHQSFIKFFNSYRPITLAIAFSSLLAPVSGTAQNENPETQNTLPEVVVSASRVPVPAEHVGSSVTVLDQEEIEKRQPTFVHELLREVPGVAVSQLGPYGGNAQIRIRGAEANHTLVTVDGIEMGDPFNSDEFEFQHLPISTIGRIEVLRGPQSSIYGSEPIGGVISIFTPVPDEGAESSVGIEHGSRKTTTTRAYFGAGIGESYASVSANRIKTDGFDASVDDVERDGFENLFIHLKAGTRVSDSVQLTAVAMRIRSESEYDGCTNSAFESSNSCLGKDKKTIFGATVSYEQMDGNLNHKLSASWAKHLRRDYVDGELANVDEQKLGKKTKLDYQGALTWETADTEQVTILAFEKETATVESPYIAIRSGELKFKSYTLEQRSNIGDNLFFSLSTRYDDNGDNNFQNRKTYRGTGAWIPASGVRIHGSYGTGAKNPTVGEIYGWTSSWEANPDLKPETSKGWDFGAEFVSNTSGMTLDVTHFRNKITDLIDPFYCVSMCDDDIFETNVYKSINNPGVSTIRGWELLARGTVRNNYEISATLTLSKGFDSKGNKLIRRPSQIFGFNVSRSFSLRGRKAEGNLNIQYSGKQLDTDFDSFPSRPVELRSRTLVNLSGSMKFNANARLRARVENLFNEDDYQEVHGYGVPGRSIFVGVQYAF